MLPRVLRVTTPDVGGTQENQMECPPLLPACAGSHASRDELAFLDRKVPENAWDSMALRSIRSSPPLNTGASISTRTGMLSVAPASLRMTAV